LILVGALNLFFSCLKRNTSMQRTAGVFGRRVTTQTSATIFGGKAFGQLRSQRWVSLEAKVKSLNAGTVRNILRIFEQSGAHFHL